MKIIGLDVGSKFIGVARVDTAVKIPVPEPAIPVDGQEFVAIARLAKLRQTNFFVIGLPRNLSGQETAQSAYSREFARKLKQFIKDAKIRFQDESLTSVEARSRLKAVKGNYLKPEIDSEAAVIILQDFIENFARKTSTTSQIETKTTPDSTSKISETKTTPNLKTKKSTKMTKIALISIPAILIVSSLATYFYYRNQLKAVSSNPACGKITKNCSPLVSFKVESGQSASQISQALHSAGLIKNPLAFQINLQLSGRAKQLKAGTFRLSASFAVSEIIDRLTGVGLAENVFRLTLTPGETLADLKKKLIKIGYSQNDIDVAFAKKYDHPLLSGSNQQNLEGYLYPETYEFYKNESLEKIILRLVDQLDQIIKKHDLEAAYKKQGLSLHQGIRLASVIQKEASPPDQPGVARVFLNRLAKSMNLGSDVTSQYAVDLVDPKPRKIYIDNPKVINIDSCYNTRKYSGIPCGAISNPGLSALLAVAQPAFHDYLFFLTGDDQKMYYSKDNAGHQSNRDKYCQKLCGLAL